MYSWINVFLAGLLVLHVYFYPTPYLWHSVGVFTTMPLPSIKKATAFAMAHKYYQEY